MEGFSSGSTSVMHDIVTNCQLAVIVLMLCALAFIIICLGSLLGEFFTEHRKFRVFLPSLVDDLKNSPEGPREVIKQSGLLLRQKQCLIELTRHPDITDSMRESMAVGLEYREQKRYDSIVKITDLMARLAPMLGLLGTLIPLGPGIIALGQGDTQTLSKSLLTAFDTTSLGLMVGGMALIISAVRNRWYRQYMVDFDAAIECILEVEKGGWRYDDEVSNEFRLSEARVSELLAAAEEPVKVPGEALSEAFTGGSRAARAKDRENYDKA
jgi:biopolymer transport protein ExbB/TolQ